MSWSLLNSESLVVATKNVAKSKSRKIKDGDTREKVKNEVETALTRKLKSIGSETKDARQKSEVKGDAVNADILSSLKVFKTPEESEDKKTPGPNIRKRLVFWPSVSTNDTPSFHEFSWKLV